VASGPLSDVDNCTVDVAGTAEVEGLNDGLGTFADVGTTGILVVVAVGVVVAVVGVVGRGGDGLGVGKAHGS